jgi:hypothetical protein
MTVPRGEVRTGAEARNYRLWDEWLWPIMAPTSAPNRNRRAGTFLYGL